MDVAQTEGPFLKAAALCENVIEDKFGVLSLIRVVDRIVQQAMGPLPPDAQMPPIEHWKAFAVVMLISGAARGTAELGLTLENPSGLRQPLGTVTVLFEGEDRGANVVLNLDLSFEAQGLYWFDIDLDRRRLTRMPLRVIFTRLSQGGPRL